ncbi:MULTISPECIES: hypothetical protein [unclassified Mameliella]|uniref:hypothetical protein n=1 Tax=unclassified Mameliella TaxID=2630630 RepID=UPI00273F34BC|nr:MULTISPECIES: hypothetical protein [unclassified Mameliella]
MSQIEDLQARITRALDRIGQGIDGLDHGAAEPADFEALRSRAEAAEQALAEAQEALAATREQAEVDRDTALASAREAAEAERDMAVANALAQAEEAREAAVAAAREQAEADRDAAIAAVKSEAAAQLERALAEARAEVDTEPAPVAAPETEPEATPTDALEVTELEEALEDEKMANAQLEERLRVLRARLADLEAQSAEAPEPETAPSPEALIALDEQLQDLRAANEELIAANTALREANAQGVGDPELINRGLQAELDAMRTMRATDAAETGAVIEALGPLLAEAADGEARE